MRRQPETSTPKTALQVLLCTMVWATACDSDTPSVQENVAKAMQFTAPKPVEQAAAAPEGPSPREQLETRREAELASAAVLPDALPKDLKTACSELVDGYDAFMKSDTDEDAALRWFYEGDRRDKLATQRAGCIRRGSVKAAACATATLPKELPSWNGVSRADLASRVLLHCANAYPEVDRTLARG